MARDDLRKKQFQFSGIYLVIGLGALLAVQVYMQKAQAPTVVPYSSFLQELRAGRLAEIQVRDTQIVATRKPDGDTKTRLVTTRLPGIDETLLLQEMEAKGVVFTGHIEVTSWIESFVLGWLLPIGFMVGLWVFFLRRMNRSGGPLSVGRNKAKIYDATQAGRVTFDDVAGVDEAEAELVEVVDFLKNPAKYTGLGARIPKGVLLVGPPGTGKTLLAKAVAGEAGVPFFSMSGSEFVEMFVGVGASRMRDLFDEAKKRAPCIVFLDELDAIGKSRGGVAALSTHDEREQTLNQLLVEMDGFETAGGVIIMAATNRPEVLDQALLRAGRFDRQVLVDRPDLRGREAILEIHMKVAKIGEGVDVKTLAQRTPGMVGADLAKVVNEAALAAARRGAADVAMPDFEESIDRILLGLKKTGRVMNEKEKWRVAYHESGHALVALSVANADPVHRVSIIPRSIGALGVTLQLPAEDRYLLTKEELLDRITVLFGGRVAEELFCSDISSGASNDIERATDIARMMATRFGMTAALGPVAYGRSHAARFLDGSDMEEKNYSEETARRIDAEVRAILDSQMERARLLIQARRSTLEAVAHRLLEVETLDRAELEALFRDTKENK